MRVCALSEAAMTYLSIDGNSSETCGECEEENARIAQELHHDLLLTYSSGNLCAASPFLSLHFLGLSLHERALERRQEGVALVRR